MDWLRLHEACDLDDRARHFPASGTMTPREVAHAAVSHSDRIWVLLRCVDRTTRVDFAWWCAAEAKRYSAAADSAVAATDSVYAARYAAYAARHAAYAARYAAYAARHADHAARHADHAADYATFAADDAADADYAAAADYTAYAAARQLARDSQIAWLLAKIYEGSESGAVLAQH
jgi:hypothetical protein